MPELIKHLGVELRDPMLWLVVAAAIVIILIIFASRFVGRVVSFKSHPKVVWATDIVFIPLFIISILFILKKVVGPEVKTLIHVIELIGASLLWLIGAWLLKRGLELFLWTTAFKKATGSESPLLIRSLVAAIIYFLAFYGIWTSVFHRPVTGLLVSTGIVAAALGLALQSVLSDFFSGLAITMENPYRVGDWIELKDGTLGQVADITWRSTRILSLNNSIYVVPNTVAAKSIIHNYNMPDKIYAYWVHVSIDSDIPPDIVLQLLMEASLTCKSVLKYPSPIVRISDVTSQPFKYMVYVYFEDYPSYRPGRSDLFSSISSCLSRAGISPTAVKYEIATREARIAEVQELTLSERLRGINIFQPLSDDDIETIAGSCQIQTFRSGEIVIEKGDTDNSLFVISSGVVSILRDEDRGRHIELARLGANDCFGEMSLLTGEPRTATVKALTNVEAINVPKEGLEPVLKAKPELSDKLAEIMAERRVMTEGFLDSRSRQVTPTLMQAYVTKIRSFFGL